MKLNSDWGEWKCSKIHGQEEIDTECETIGLVMGTCEEEQLCKEAGTKNRDGLESQRVIRTEDREGEGDRELANFDSCLLIWVT